MTPDELDDMPRNRDYFYIIDFPDRSHEACRMSNVAAWVMHLTNQEPGMYVSEFLKQHPKAKWNLVASYPSQLVKDA